MTDEYTGVPSRLLPLLKQFDGATEQLRNRLAGLSDDEYFWEPVAHCWSVRRPEQIRSGNPVGGGDWLIDQERPEPDPPPLTTIAWRMNHLAVGLTMRTDYTTGSRAMQWQDYHPAGTAEDGTAALTEAFAGWRLALTSMSDTELDQVGRSSFPWGWDPRLPFLDIVYWVNQELISHGAEIALLRDLYRAQHI